MADDRTPDTSAEARALQSSRSRDAAGFGRAAGELQEPLFRLAWRVTQDSQLAEEAAARVLVKLWTSGHTWRGEASARTWVYRLAVRTAIDLRRGRVRWWRRFRGGSVGEEQCPAEGAEEGVIAREEAALRARRVQAALAVLSPADRALIHLYYYEDHDLAAIAEILEESRDVLKMRLLRARRKLKPLLEAEYARYES